MFRTFYSLSFVSHFSALTSVVTAAMRLTAVLASLASLAAIAYAWGDRHTKHYPKLIRETLERQHLKCRQLMEVLNNATSEHLPATRVPKARGEEGRGIS